MAEWVSVEDELPVVLEVRIKLIDGSEVNCFTQADGDFWWDGAGPEIFISLENVTHWKALPDTEEVEA